MTPRWRLDFENYRYNQPYGAQFNTETREVTFYNREYSRLGSRESNEGQLVPVDLYEHMQIYDTAPARQARPIVYTRARSRIDAHLIATFAGYTVLFAADDPDRIVPSGLVGHVTVRVVEPLQIEQYKSLWHGWRGLN